MGLLIGTRRALLGETAFTPRTLPGLLLWLDATKITGLADGAGVNTWNDLSGNGYHFTEATNPPTYKVNILNGRPVVRFDGFNDVLTAASQISFAAAKTLFLVFSAASSAGTRNIFHSDVTVNDCFAIGIGNNLAGAQFFNSPTAYSRSGVINTTSAYILSVTKTAGNVAPAMWISGASQSGTTAIAQGTGLTMALGRAASAGAFCQADVAEFFIYNRVLSAAERQAVERYLSIKWAIPLS